MIVSHKHLPQLVLAEVAIAVVGFVISFGWGSITRRTMDRDSTFFLLKMWGGIALVLVVIAFLMVK